MENRKQVKKVISMLKAYDEKTLQEEQLKKDKQLKEDPKTPEQKELIMEAIKIIFEYMEILKADNTKDEEVGKNGR